MTSTILKSLVAAAVLASAPLAMASPAMAERSGQTKTVLKYDAKMKKYCVTDPAATGSRIAKITCKTDAQWAADGLVMPKRAAPPVATAAAAVPVSASAPE